MNSTGMKTLVQCDFDNTIAESDVSFMLLDAFADGDWQQLAGIGSGPEGAGRLIVLLWADGQCSEEDAIWWDDVAVFRVD